MRIRTLTLEGFQSYREAETVDLTDQNLVAIVGKNHTGKCLPGDTPVWDPERGESLPLEQFVREERPTTLGFTEGKVVPVPVSAWHRLGQKETVRIRMEDGSEIITARTHPVLTDQGCRQAGSLSVGDWVAQVSHLPSSEHDRLTEDEALILGCFLGDGCVTSRFTTFCCADPELLAALRAAIGRTFPGAALAAAKGSLSYYVISALTREERDAVARSVIERMRGSVASLPVIAKMNWVRNERLGRVGWDTLIALEEELGWDLASEKSLLFPRRAFAEWMASLGVIGLNSYTKTIPANLTLMPKAQTAALLRGLWMTDGWISAGDKSRAAVFTSVSRDLAEGVRRLLLVLGIHSTLRRKLLPGGSTAFNVGIIGRDWKSFGEQLSILGSKGERVQDHLSKVEPANPKSKLGMIPPSFARPEMPGVSASGRQARTIRQLATHAMNPDVFLDFGGDPAVVEAEVFWCRVVSIEEAAPVECFDLTVDTPEHLFVAGTFIVHNSSLFDALMFALYARSRGPVVNDVISRGMDRTEVTLVFDLNGDTYRLSRSRTRKGRHEVYLSISDPDMPGGWRDLNEKNSKNTDPYLIELLGMDSRVAQLTWFVGQANFGLFCDMMPSARRQALGEAFGLDRYAVHAEQAEAMRRKSDAELSKALWTQSSAQARVESLTTVQAFPDLDNEALVRAAQEVEAEVEALARDLGQLDDPQLEKRAADARAALAAFRQDFASHEARYNQERDRLTSDINQAKAALERADKDLEAAQVAGWDLDPLVDQQKAAQEKIAALESSLENLSVTISDVRAKGAALDSERTAITAKAEEINERRGPLEVSLSKGNGECFTCGQSLTAEQAQELIVKQDQQKEDLRGQHRQRSSQLHELTQRLNGLTEESRKVSQEAARARAEEQDIARTLAKTQALADSAEEREKAVTWATTRLQSAQESLANLQAPIMDQKREADLAEMAATAQADLEKAAGNQAQRADLATRHAAARSRMRSLWGEQNRREVAATELAEVRATLEEANGLVERLTKDVRAYEVLVEGFKPSGVPALILAGIVEELNEDANDLLDEMGDDALGVLVSTQKENQKGSTEEKVMVYAITTDGQVDYSTLSGSEKFRIALAIRLGLARCIARRTGTPIETIVVDEGWGALDAETQRAVQTVFAQLSTEFAILTVSHIEEVATAFPTLVQVSMDTGTSRTETIAR